MEPSYKVTVDLSGIGLCGCHWSAAIAYPIFYSTMAYSWRHTTSQKKVIAVLDDGLFPDVTKPLS